MLLQGIRIRARSGYYGTRTGGKGKCIQEELYTLGGIEAADGKDVIAIRASLQPEARTHGWIKRLSFEAVEAAQATRYVARDGEELAAFGKGAAVHINKEASGLHIV